VKITIEIDSPGSSRISARVVAGILMEMAAVALRRGSAAYHEPLHRLHIASSCAHDSVMNDCRICGEMFLEPGDSEKIP